ncbi:ABC transporter substrate-binding protein [Fimbriimonas ginsengisoli]|uniref:Extracellular ligand-binding receptor n=1 Tax=Fimbriimonas ginsengisoli Gsoil 348 TaxID=661478 RepID=A0A068NVR2_FIMGI|nr:ABC transporter substrate-binding protein [Fimbriimonas ginsengisoli]AIE87583.1 Extracellular ligand-binding receptor [Fimbriimonas ginsengisoli Gsoil 348]
MHRFFIAVSISAGLLAGCGGHSSSPTIYPNATPVGAMLDQTGTLTDFTPEFTAACQLAVEDENARLAAIPSGTRFNLILRDSKSNDAGAEEAINGFIGDHVSFVMGPRISSQCKRVLPIAQTHDIAVVSTRSVSDDLSIPNDALFRLISPDREVIPLVANDALGRGLKSICVLYRNDIFGNNALQIMTDKIRAGGGNIVYSQPYAPTGTPSDGDLQTFADAVRAQKALHGAETGIAYFGLSELVPAFAKLNAQPDDFRTVNAVASQSLANIPSMVTNAQAEAYCAACNFQAVAFALADHPAKELPAGSALLARIAARSGKATPDELSINVYDGMRAMLRAAQHPSGSAITSMQKEFATSPLGTIDTMHFDANGDRLGDFYGIYKIDTTGTPAWTRIATLTP